MLKGKLDLKISNLKSLILSFVCIAINIFSIAILLVVREEERINHVFACILFVISFMAIILSIVEFLAIVSIIFTDVFDFGMSFKQSFLNNYKTSEYQIFLGIMILVAIFELILFTILHFS